MIALTLVVLGSILLEFSTALGKYEVKRKKESLYAFGFLSGFWALVILLITGFLFQDTFIFSLASLPTFGLRAILEIVLLFITLHAILAADRSTYAFLRILTIPLLLAVDMSIGYSITSMQISGIGVVLATVFLLSLHHELSRRGKLLCVASAVLAVVVISLYKYNITHFNSVEAEQSAMVFINLVALFVAARVQKHENVFSYFSQPLCLIQSLAMGAAGILISFAYLFAPASIIITAERSCIVLASIVSGRIYFHEKHVWLKLAAAIAIVMGVVLATL